MRVGNNTIKIIKISFFCLTIILSIILIYPNNDSYAADVDSYTVYGYITFNNSLPIPNGVNVVFTNQDPHSYTWVTRFDSNNNPGFYFAGDIYAIEGTSSGEEIDITVDYGGCTGSESFNAQEKGSERIDITICCNLPPDKPSQPDGTTTGISHVAYNFSTSAEDLESPPDNVKYGWDWDDNNVVDEWTGFYASNATCNITHTWNDTGSYSIKVKAQDENGAEQGEPWSNTLDITISNIAPTADFSYASASPKTGETVQFYDKSTDQNGEIVSWHWDFDNGEESTDRNSTNIYYDPGNYQVTLTVTDDNDDTDFATSTVTVTGESVTPPPENQLPTADFSYEPSKPFVNTTVNFTDSSIDTDGNIVSWNWTFGDGTNSTERHPSHNYTQSGSYQVELTVTDNNDGNNITQKTLTIIEPYNGDNNTIAINLLYHEKNKGANYIVWKGPQINASDLALLAELSNGESISIFNSNTGKWIKYIVGISSILNDFVISPLDIIIITVKSDKTLILDASNADYTTSESIELHYNFNSATKVGNPGLNFVIWPADNQIKASELTSNLTLSTGFTVYKYDQQTSIWLTYIVGVGLDETFDFTIAKYDILCIYVLQEKSLTIT